MKKLFSASIIVFTLLLLNSGSVFAQDVIIKKNKEEIKCKVIEIGVNEIKCKLENNPEGPVFVFRKDEVSKIKYANGTETEITPDKYSANLEQAILDKKNVIKFDLFAPLTGNLTFGYERVLKVGTNLEGKLGIIGPQIGSFNDHASGAFIKGGIKFLSGQDFYIDGMRYAHPLKGKYVKLELIYSSFTNSVDHYSLYYIIDKPTSYTTHNNAFAMNVCLGKQWILGNTLTLDIYGGVGFGVSSVKITNATADAYIDDTPYFYSHLGGTESSPFIISGGFSLGYIL
ncbi:MAG: hypothetical protein ACI7YS_01885 [Flavobacterium sp.]